MSKASWSWMKAVLESLTTVPKCLDLYFPSDSTRLPRTELQCSARRSSHCQVLDLFPYVLGRSINSSVAGLPSYACGQECWTLFVANVTAKIQRFAKRLVEDTDLPVNVYLRSEHPDPQGIWINQDKTGCGTTQEVAPSDQEDSRIPVNSHATRPAESSVTSSGNKVSDVTKASTILGAGTEEESGPTPIYGVESKQSSSDQRDVKHYRSLFTHAFGPSGSTRCKLETSIDFTVSLLLCHHGFSHSSLL